MDNNIYEKAQAVMTKRRTAAMHENDRRIEEINEKIPEIREINSHLFSTSRELLSIITSGRDVSDKVEKLKNANVQAQEIARQLLTGNGYPADYLDMHYNCDKCDDTGYSNGGACDCFKRVLGNLSAEEMNKNAQIKLSSFDAFSLDYYSGSDRVAMKHIFEYAKNYANNFTSKSDGIIMFGDTGVGKTHISLAIAKIVLDKGYSVIYDSIMNILRKIEREHFGRDDGDILLTVLDCDLLILDDLGTELKTPFYSSTIYTIVNTRINRGKPTIMSTNLDLDNIDERYEPRVVSRLYSYYKYLEFKGEDIRFLKRNGHEKN